MFTNSALVSKGVLQRISNWLCHDDNRGHCFPVWDVAAGPLGHYFASASADRTARVWCTERAQPLRLLVGHHSDVSAVRWHPNSHYVATGSHDRTVRLWDIRDGKSQRILIGHRAAVRPLFRALS